MRSRAPLVLMEQMVMLAVFALCAAICVQAFALSDQISRRGAELDGAVARAENMSEVWKSCGGDAAAAAAAYGGTVEQWTWIVCCNERWEQCAPGAAVYQIQISPVPPGNAGLPSGLQEATVEAFETEKPGAEALLTWTVACQEALQ